MEITYSAYHNGFSINTNMLKGEGCIISILDKYERMLAYMLANHSKVMQVRFDVRYPRDGSVIPDGRHIYAFNYNLTRKLKRERIGGHLTDPQLLAVMEQDSSPHPHYHYVLLVNGNAREHYFTLLKDVVEPLWQRALNTRHEGLVSFCDAHGPNGLMISRSSSDAVQKIQECSYQASYIAKIRSKESRPKGAWLAGGTRLPASASGALASVFTDEPVNQLRV